MMTFWIRLHQTTMMCCVGWSIFAVFSSTYKHRDFLSRKLINLHFPQKNISNCSWHHWHPWEKREYIPTFNDIFTALFSTPLFYYKILMYPPHVSLTAQMQSLSMTYERIIVCARRVIESNGWTWSGMILLQHTVRNIGKVETHIIVAKNGDNQFVSV